MSIKRQALQAVQEAEEIFVSTSEQAALGAVRQRIEAIEDFADYPDTLGNIQAGKTRNGANWSPRDAMLRVLKQMDNGEVDFHACAFIAIDKNEDAGISTVWTVSSPDIATTLGMFEIIKNNVIETGN